MPAGRLFLMLAVFLGLGVPIVAILWHSVNQVSAGDLARLVVAIPLAVVFAAFLLVFGRCIHRLERER